MIKFLFVIISLIIIGCIFLISSQYYPVAIVNFGIITAKDFNKDYSVSLNYYKTAMDLYVKDSKALDAEEVKLEIKRAVLSGLIENILIEEELKKELSEKDIASLVNKKIDNFNNSANIQKAAEKLYGLRFEEFQKRILYPTAEKEILEGRLILKNENFEEYMAKMRGNAMVIILLPGFDWNGKEAIIKK